MQALSVDLRERIVAAYESDDVSKAEIARRFSVSRGVVIKLVQQKQELGTLEPLTHQCGRKSAIAGEMLDQLRAHVRDHPDATLAERLEALGLTCTRKTLCQTLKKYGWRFKKNVACE